MNDSTKPDHKWFISKNVDQYIMSCRLGEAETKAAILHRIRELEKERDEARAKLADAMKVIAKARLTIESSFLPAYELADRDWNLSQELVGFDAKWGGI